MQWPRLHKNVQMYSKQLTVHTGWKRNVASSCCFSDFGCCLRTGTHGCWQKHKYCYTVFLYIEYILYVLSSKRQQVLMAFHVYEIPHEARSTVMWWLTIRLPCPATQSSGRLPGQCWEGPPDSPLWTTPERNAAWRGRPSSSLCEHNFLHPFPTSQELHRSLWPETPALLHCW